MYIKEMKGYTATKLTRQCFRSTVIYSIPLILIVEFFLVCYSFLRLGLFSNTMHGTGSTILKGIDTKFCIY